MHLKCECVLQIVHSVDDNCWRRSTRGDTVPLKEDDLCSVRRRTADRRVLTMSDVRSGLAKPRIDQ